jgi:hypothetical protein
MAAPSVPSTGSRAVYFPAAPPVRPDPNIPVAPGISPTLLPGAFGTPPQPVQQVDMPIPGASGLPAIVLRVGPGGSPDFQGTVLLVFGIDGTVYTRSGMVSTTTWSGAGSLPTVAHWQLSDALA